MTPLCSQALHARPAAKRERSHNPIASNVSWHHGGVSIKAPNLPWSLLLLLLVLLLRPSLVALAASLRARSALQVGCHKRHGRPSSKSIDRNRRGPRRARLGLVAKRPSQSTRSKGKQPCLVRRPRKRMAAQGESLGGYLRNNLIYVEPAGGCCSSASCESRPEAPIRKRSLDRLIQLWVELLGAAKFNQLIGGSIENWWSDDLTERLDSRGGSRMSPSPSPITMGNSGLAYTTYTQDISSAHFSVYITAEWIKLPPGAARHRLQQQAGHHIS